ncbi:DegV family protein [Paenibacillus polygoni]|uniref:DegV family protein n=1 Tax=Paenibacillus polygoni TaxID=3050112 RepID=A0ABY8X8P3_9BACL|nr:DegV family protein [Paenibacillus polygoni]WIV20513.1 DegV family protein [Paenibacillus polygoni]
MSRIKIFADSTSDLPKTWVQQHEVGIVPLYAVFGDESLKDGVEISPEQLYARVDREGRLPKTAAPSPADFMASFGPYIDQGYQVLFISLSSELSSTYQNALIASGEFPDGSVTVFDSLNLSSGIGVMVMKAVQAAEQGKTITEIVDILTEMRPKVEIEFVIDTLDYLYMGGRCSGMQNLIGSLLKIRPVIKVTDGKMTPAYKVRGKREKAIDQMMNNALSNVDVMDNDTIIVVHSMCEEDALAIQKTLHEKTKAKHIEMATAGCVISSHCGPKTIGLVFVRA